MGGMRSTSRWAAIGIVCAAWAATAGPATAAWEQLPGTSNNDITTEPATLGLPDGSYEIAYRVRGSDPGKEALAGAVLSPDGKVVAAAPLTGDWASLTNPGLTMDGSSLRAYWGGIADPNWQSPVPGLETATAPGPGGPWQGQFGGIEVATCQGDVDPACPPGGYLAELYSYGSDISAASTAAGPLAAWSGTLGVYVRVGTTPPRDTDAGPPGFPAGDDPEDPNNQQQVNQEGNDDHSTYPAPSFQPACCGYEPRLAIDSATGRPYLGWFSNASSKPGTLIELVDPSSGAPQLGPYTVPGSTDSAGLRGRTPLTGVPGSAGVYTAIPEGKGDQEVVLAGFGVEPNSTFATPRIVISKGGDGEVRNTAITADDSGNLWIVWTRDTIDGLKVFASRYELKSGKFTTPTETAGPPDASDSYTLDAVPLGNDVEVLGSFGPTPGGGMGALWHSSLGLTPTVSAPQVTVAKGSKATVALHVTLAGKPIAGATVTVIGASASRVHKRPIQARTNQRGIVHLRLGPFHHSITIRLRISKRGYASTTVKVHVRVKRH